MPKGSIRVRLMAAAALLSLAGAALADDAGLKVVDHIKVGGDGGWDYATLDADNRLLYIAHGTAIVSVGLDTGVVNPKALPAAGAHIALPVNGGAQVLITSGQTQTVALVDAATGAVKATVPTGKKPDAAAFEPTTGLAFVAENGGAKFDLIDPKTGALAGTIPVAGALEFAVADGAGKVFVNLEDKNQIAVIDAAACKVVATYALAGCDGPSGLAYIPEPGYLLAACGGNVAKVIRASDGADIATLAIGKGPDAAFYDASAKQAYIPSGDGQLAVIRFDGGAPKVIGLVATQRGARTGAVDPKTGRVYLPSAKFGPPATPGGRPSVVPGSFEIVVVGK